MEPRADLRHFDRAWFGASVSEFLDSSRDEILGRLVASSGYAVELAQRDAWVDPVTWFLSERDDVRSSFHLEDVATEFQVQGLELDWTCVVWDADFRFAGDGWQHHSFVGSRWQHIRKLERQTYLKNAYRVLLTRARQGMVIVVPEGSSDDTTRSREFYDGTFNYLRRIGLPLI
jgi:Uncharacterized conserved protein (DUF2075)